MSVVLDSRLVQEGDLFVALIGENHNGHDFLEEAARKGATSALVDGTYSGLDFGLELRRGNVVEMLQEMAAIKVRSSGAKVIGVTGSVGKTTIKEFVASVLSVKYSVMKSPGSFNSQVGLPVAILNSELAEVMVLEMGMSKPGEMTKLTKMAQPHIVVLGRIGFAHAMNFEDLDAIAYAKSEILASPRLEYLVVHEKSLAFEAIETVDVHRERYGDGNAPFKETHLRENYQAAKLVAKHFGMSDKDIAQATCTMPPHRFIRLKKGNVDFLDDSYNANGDSMKAALANLPEAKRVIAVLGEMRELGKFSKQVHREVGEFARGKVDEIIALGNECQPLLESFGSGKLCASLEEVIAEVKRIYQDGDLVLLKGSNTNQLWRVVEAFE